MKNTELLKSYNKNGFYIAKSALNSDQVSEVLSSINNLFKQQLGILNLNCLKADDAESIRGNMKSLFEKDGDRYLKVLKALARVYELNKLFFSKEILDLINGLNIYRPLVPTGPVMHIMSDALKIPGGYHGMPAHQDYPSMQGSLDSVVVWIPLVDIDRDLYPLEVIPGSNNRGLLDGKTVGSYCYEVDKACYAESDFVPVEVEAGDVVLMSSFTIHRSGQKGRDNFVRLSCSSRFDNSDEETFIDRGYPTVYKRSVERDILEPGFPTKEHVRKIFSND